jgi:hypothetical protein
MAADVAISKGRPAKCTYCSGLGRVATTAAATFKDLGALVFSDHALDLKKQIVLCRAPYRPIEEHDLSAATSEFLNEQNLVRIATRQTVGSKDIDPIDAAISHGIT